MGDAEVGRWLDRKDKGPLRGGDSVGERSRPVTKAGLTPALDDPACAEAFTMLEWEECMPRWAVVGEAPVGEWAGSQSGSD